MGGVADLHSDPIGRGLAAIHVVALWSLLTIMTAIASLKGNAPRLTKVLALVIVPVSGFVAMAAMDLLWHADRSPFLWPIVILVVVPPLAVTWCFLVLLGRSGISRIVGALPVAILAVCLLMEPLSRMRNTVEKGAAVRLAQIQRGSRAGAGQCADLGLDAVSLYARRLQAVGGGPQHPKPRSAAGAGGNDARPRRLSDR
ncbi:hypothetical protein Q2941_15630 [Bradyrhizobium sp. UFLA05-153]